MDRNALLHPVGPLPARVYWTRRLAPLAVVLLLIVVIAVACSGGSGPARHTSSATTPTATPSSAHPTKPAANGRCGRAQITLTASTDATTYPAGIEPVLRLTIRNTGSTRCVLIDSPSTRTWTIVSGADRVWTTAGCNASHIAARVPLAPGASTTHTLTWNRHRSGQNCTTSSATAAPGTYQLVVTANGVTSAPAVFHLTG
jgi:hypothetical protein